MTLPHLQHGALLGASKSRAARTVNRTRFEKDLSAPDPIPQEAIDAAVELMRDGRLFRYSEDRNGLPVTALFEEEFAAAIGRRYAVGVNSGGCALFLGLKSVGVMAGDKVLLNAFTLAPVPGAIAHAGAKAVLVDITDSYTIDIEDLDRKASESGARFLMLSYMRGHIPDMDAVMAVCRRHGLTVVEDCAHTMGADWDGRLVGNFGDVACFSTQTFKHLNSGEGGLLATDNEDAAARAVLMSGSYMLYAQHRARPEMEVFERHRYTTPNYSMRMSGMVAAILRPQLMLLDERVARWREVYGRLVELLRGVEHISIPKRSPKEGYVPSSLQFHLTGLDAQAISTFLRSSDEHGVHVKWFGREDPVGFTSRHDHWRYLEGQADVPHADHLLKGLCDMRLPLWLGEEDCHCIAAVLREAMTEAISL